MTQTDLETPAMLHFATGEVAVFTRRSPQKDTVNEDCAALIPYSDDAGVLVITDGLGGQPNGETASATAITCMKQAITQAIAKALPLRDAILDGIERANRLILNQASGAATTLALVEIQANIIRPYHVGDSMILLTGQRGKTKLQSVSHSPVGYAVESGLLDVDEAIHHEERHLISNVVGAQDMSIEIGSAIKMAQRDTLILASDGLFDNLYLDEIINTIRIHPLHQVAKQLLALTEQRMNAENTELPCHPDDLTFILFRQKS